MSIEVAVTCDNVVTPRLLTTSSSRTTPPAGLAAMEALEPFKAPVRLVDSVGDLRASTTLLRTDCGLRCRRPTSTSVSGEKKALAVRGASPDAHGVPPNPSLWMTSFVRDSVTEQWAEMSVAQRTLDPTGTPPSYSIPEPCAHIDNA
jgi:hypothetical protein